MASARSSYFAGSVLYIENEKQLNNGVECEGGAYSLADAVLVDGAERLLAHLLRLEVVRLEPDGLQVVLRAAAELVALNQRVQLPEVLLSITFMRVMLCSQIINRYSDICSRQPQ